MVEIILNNVAIILISETKLNPPFPVSQLKIVGKTKIILNWNAKRERYSSPQHETHAFHTPECGSVFVK